MIRPGPRILPGAFALVVAIAAPLRAQSKAEVNAASNVETPEQQRARALELFDKSVGLYESGRFREAASLLEQAYGTFPEPVLLYNLARAYQESGELAKAIDAYERFLAADPDVKDRGGIEQRVVTLREQLQAAERAKAEAPPPPAGKSEAKESKNSTTPTARSDDEGSASIVPWVIAGTGVLALGTGVVLGVVAKGHHDDAQNASSALAAQSEQQQAENFALASNVTLVAGGVLAAVGTAWGIVVVASSSNEAASTPRRELAIGPRSARFTLHF